VARFSFNTSLFSSSYHFSIAARSPITITIIGADKGDVTEVMLRNDLPTFDILKN
jgi:hypothetical protein